MSGWRGVAAAAYGLCLRAFPGWQRLRYGAEMEEAFRAELRGHSAREGRGAALRFAAAACLDALRAGRGERRRAATTRASGRGWHQGFQQDLTYAVRSLARSWTFSFVCLFSLAIGLGVSLALVLLLRATMQPPFELETEGLVELLVSTPGDLDGSWSYPDFLDVEEGTATLQLAGSAQLQGTLRATAEEGGQRVAVAYVSPGYFQLLGVPLSQGRPFTPEDERAGEAVPVVIGHDFWQGTLAADPQVIGRVVQLNREPHVVVGVAGELFAGHRTGAVTDVWAPLAEHPHLAHDAPQRTDRDAAWLQIIARLDPGTRIEQADAEVRSVTAAVAAQHLAGGPERVGRVLPFHWQGAALMGGSEGMLIPMIFFTAVGILLLVVCLNLSGMILVRSAMRERELAVRLALGSSRWRLVRFLMTEAVVLAVAGGMLVIAVFWAAVQGLSWHFGFTVPTSLAVDAQLVAVCLGLALAATLVFGLLPALQFSRPRLLATIKDDVGTGGRRTGRIHKVATALQTALAIPALVVAGGITVGGLSMARADFGFPRENLFLAAPLDLAADGYDPLEARAFTESLVEAARTLPGVVAVGAAEGMPLDGARRTRSVASERGVVRPYTRVTRVGHGYLDALGVPVLRGRAIAAGDRVGAEPVAVITAALAALLFPGEEALGETLILGPPGRGSAPDGSASTPGESFTIVGVVGDVAGRSLDASGDNVFLSLWQEPTTQLALAVRAVPGNENLPAAIQRVALTLDPQLGRPVVQPFQAIVDRQARDFSFWSAFFGGIAFLLLLLSALGVYGVVAFAVANRTREIGVRMSLGATRETVLRQVLRDAVRLALPGLILGGAAGTAVAQLLLNPMYADIGLPVGDLRLIGVAALAALAVVLLASLTPARRAASVDPMRAMRAQ